MAGTREKLTAGGYDYLDGRREVVERPFRSGERNELGDAVATLGDTTLDAYLNGRAYLRNVPPSVWGYKLGGYQVLKKWL